MQFVQIDGCKYSKESLPENCIELTQLVSMAQEKINSLMNEHAVITRAKNAYIEDLKSEVIESKSGFDIAQLILDD